jgi:hypothetical protein
MSEGIITRKCSVEKPCAVFLIIRYETRERVLTSLLASAVYVHAWGVVQG